MKEQFTTDLFENGKAVNSVFAVKFKKPPVDYRGKPGKWFELRLSDRKGEITAKFWGTDPDKTVQLYESLVAGDIVAVKGVVQEYRGSFSISIDEGDGSLGKCLPDEYNLEDFVASSPKDPGKMLEEAKQILSAVNDENLKKLISSFLEDREFMDAFIKSPAAMEYHQNYKGGLLEHTLNVLKICNSLCLVHPELNRDLVLTGAFIHDIGKIKEFNISPAQIDVSHQGMLEGHTAIGYAMLSDMLGRIENFPEKLRFKLMHIILSHHGKAEYGSPKQPQFPEAVAVYYADECDAKLALYLRLKKEANTEDSWVWSRKIKGHVYIE
jgi:3'-5' exoribonuclease